jgi:glycosyltransferase involved in cell wall biosynthesis
LYLGRLAPEKGVETLVRAMGKNRKIALKIVGAGPLEEELRAYIREKRLKNIELAGFKSGAEKWRILRDSAFVVVPSECYETFGLSALEAYTAGKCVIASRLGALPYIVEEGRSGLLFRAGDVGELSEMIRRLWSQPEEIEEMGRYARGLAETKYTPEENFALLRQILMGAVSRHWFERRIA